MTTKNEALQAWVEEVAQLTKPDRIHWCDGSDAEYKELLQIALATGDLIELNKETHPSCYLHRSHPTDVARTEHLTFICTQNRDDAGPNNNWISPAEGHDKIDSLFDGCMQGRTMYVLPYCMGPIDSPLARCGVEITDSLYVVLSMRVMTRMGKAALARIERDGNFVRGLHSTGDLSPERRFIMHFPEELMIKSIGSGYGGNALLGKKCHALRIASWQAKSEGWLAEHMLIVGIQNPEGLTRYVAAAFPSACGKTNLAMLIPPATMPGWKVWTVGDDIAWLHLGEDGQLWAINPEAGFFGVAPGTGPKTNPTALNMLDHDTIFTNVGVTADKQPWWEGKNKSEVPVIDWKGNPFDPAGGPAAHPNSRFTVAARQCASASERMEDPAGVPISAIVFGGRRAELAPLVFEARDWKHGVLVGAAVASETTAAATGAVGVVRRDPMAMQPFCGYNFADYWTHWLGFAEKSSKLPKVFHVNWFRQDGNGNFIWPGFGENLRVIEWILGRCEGTANAVETPIGYMPAPSDLDTKNLDIEADTIEALLSIDPAAWQKELDDIRDYFNKYGEHMPRALWDELETTREALEAKLAAA
ncbi:phosphoenolpyruvate carboxykinase (GTP) [Plasticicumulans acidivorans]|uniref:Phosphoenolpyruvate carboxykinase [GTP] n=2 Tax=Plasticicumulans acidivorans TaxID=886464 RepID=A0A317N095_9GAMM|nr:phosphoenolpyruvate carboxykinase (GTP) [Plasticicumulans acidivorans]PWV65866.1 phosphoenolpyruvate carboxykinase (GTP) [Plasticicumulans acidivorans]